MRVEVIGKSPLQVTDAIREHAAAKAAKLHKHYDGIQLVTIRVGQDDHKHSPTFGVEVVVDVQKHPDFVSHASDKDLYAAIDLAIHKSERQLTDFKERLKQGR